MTDDQKTRDQLLTECAALRQRCAELEAERIKRQWVERALRESRAEYSAIVEAFDGLIYVCSPDHEIQFANERVIKKLGRNVVGEQCYRALHDNESVCPWCVTDRVFQGETVRWEVLDPTDDRWYLVVCTPLRHPDGRVSQLSISRDLTELKRIEQELVQAREELEQRVAERTEELSRANELLRIEICERQRTENALRKSEARYRDLAELLPQIVFELDRDGRFTFVNRTGLENLGYQWQELAAIADAAELVVSEDRKRLLTSIRRVTKGEQLVGGQYRLHRKDGSTFPVLIYSSAIQHNGEVVGIRGVAIDITDLRRAQETLWIKDSALVSSISAIAMTDLEGILTYVNPAFLKAWGYQWPKQVLGKPSAEFWHDPNEAREVAKALADNGWWTGELVARKRDGSLFDAQVCATMVTDETGKPICMMASFLDVTEQKRLREALRSSEERFRAIFEGALDCIYIKDESLRYTHVNPAMEKLVGLTAPEIIGRSAEEIFGEKETKRLVEVHLRALKGESVEEEHTRSVKGEDLTFHEITVPLRSAQGLIVGTCTISRNITELRRTQPVPRIKVRNYPSEAMSATLEQAHYAAARDSIVLLTGESGSGKDYVAQWIHSHSRRASGPFFAINCAALPQELAESELFGYEPGAFTGARARKRGMLELAEGGTLLLNEIGELPLALQSKLLTFLDTRSFMRVGGEKNIHINARIVAATHRDLEDEVASGRFLPALFYRLNVFCVNVPPLRERTDDIPILVEEILSILAAEMQLTEIPLIGSASMRVLMKYHWPGNVRELRNVLERALMLWDRGPFKLAIPGLDKTPEDWMCKVTFPLDRSLHEVTEEIRATLCSEALRRAQGNKKEAARILGISRYSFYRYVKSSGIECEYLT